MSQCFVATVSFRYVLVASLLVLCCAADDNAPPCPNESKGYLAPICCPSWHPAGDLIVFDLVPLISTDFPNGSQCPGNQVLDWVNMGLYGYSCSTHEIKKMAPWTVFRPFWSPAGDRLVFDNASDIYTAGFDGTDIDTLDIRRLTFNGSNTNPVWSPDGRSIAYMRMVACPQNTPAIDSTSCGTLLMGPDGTMKRKIAQGGYPSWFPDSRRLTYVGLWENFFTIDLVDSTVIKLTNFKQGQNIRNSGVSVSPDGNTIAFVSDQGAGYATLWAVNPDGTRLRRINSDGILSEISWSQDSRTIAYVRYRANDWSAENGALWVVNIETGQKQLITNGKLP
jgi:WD40-like Beta Propeller Repeat